MTTAFRPRMFLVSTNHALKVSKKKSFSDCLKLVSLNGTTLILNYFSDSKRGKVFSIIDEEKWFFEVNVMVEHVFVVRFISQTFTLIVECVEWLTACKKQ